MVKKKIGLLFIFGLLSVCMLMSCTISLKERNTQNEKQYVVWQSESNDYGIDLQFSVYVESASHFGTISFNDKTYDIAMDRWDLNFIVSRVNYYGEIYEFVDFSGRYSIKGENTVELRIYADDMFGGALYEKTIVVNAYDMEDTVHDVAVLSEVCWETENDLLTLYTYQSMRNFSVGVYSDGAAQYDIVVYWLPECLFEAYELLRGVQQSAVIMYGTYVCGKNTLELTYHTSDDKEHTLFLTSRSTLVWEYPNELWYPE